MSRRLVNVTLDNLNDVPFRCRSCVFWELDPVSGERACDSGSAELEKEALGCGITAVFSKLDDLTTLVSNARAVCGIE